MQVNCYNQMLLTSYAHTAVAQVVLQVSTSCLFAYLEATFQFDINEAGLWFSALWAFNRYHVFSRLCSVPVAHYTSSAYAFLGTRLLVPRIGESNVTIIGFTGSSIGLAIFAIGAVSGNQILANTCAGLVSMSGMVLPPSFIPSL
jgi:hypothetical protein